MSQPISFRQRVAALFDDDVPQSMLSHAVNISLAALILVNVAAVILESVEPLRDRYSVEFILVEHIATIVFAIEYILRVWTSVDLQSGRFRQPFTARLHYMIGFFPLIDLIAVLPAFLGFFGAADLRVLRLLRLLRMLKLTRHSNVFGLLWDVLREEAQAITALIFVICLTLTVSGALMYMIEGDDQPKMFSSIPAGMWWAIETITTVGYGDMVPVTFAGRVLGGIISVIGIGTLALFSGLITVSYLNQLKIRREQHPHRYRYHPHDDHTHVDHAHGHHIQSATHAVCPHCGNNFTVSATADTAHATPAAHTQVAEISPSPQP